MIHSDVVILDQEHLFSYTSGDEDLQKRILELFIENAPSYLATLSRPNNENWRSDAHKLKGTARAIGAKRLAEIAEKAEKLGVKQVSNADQRTMLLLLHQVLDETINFIKAAYFPNRVL
ncbi:Hpt domain-containing protein [Kordiimonas aquimaris]|uniref:Hpt domain-containing protein n=1 Tax=Kordiimonas aquimaris TaxID=707591 RepID=UPI0021CFE2E4|nr:Hpt domain-containing protein [Kordiimonas aquimaris]